ncbi:MAG: DUF2336 domain-containing protein [Alphaproteobacteria bacterium]
MTKPPGDKAYGGEQSRPMSKVKMTTQLSQADVAKLLTNPAPSARAEVASKIGLDLDSPRLTEREVELAQDVIRVLAKDVAVSVRESLSLSLRKAQRLPHDVALQLARDVDRVALPVLEDCLILTDSDLISIVQGENSESKHNAIAGRPEVSPVVSDALVDRGTEKVVATLVGNSGAQIGDGSLNKAIDRFPESEAVQDPLVKREKLPVTVAERLVVRVSEKLRDYLVTHHELSPAMAADMVLQSRERATINLVSQSSETDVEKLVVQLYRNKRLTPSLVLRALCMGDMAFFEASIAVMSNVPLVNARILIHDAGRLGLKALYDKSGLPPRLLPAVRVAMDVVRETELDGGENDMERYRCTVIERILTQFEDMQQEDIEYLIDKLGDMMDDDRAA